MYREVCTLLVIYIKPGNKTTRQIIRNWMLYGARSRADDAMGAGVGDRTVCDIEGIMYVVAIRIFHLQLLCACTHVRVIEIYEEDIQCKHFTRPRRSPDEDLERTQNVSFTLAVINILLYGAHSACYARSQIELSAKCHLL